VRESHKRQQIQDTNNRNKYIDQSRTKHPLSKSISANERDQLESSGEAGLRVTPTVSPRYKVVSFPKDINDLPNTNSLITGET